MQVSKKLVKIQTAIDKLQKAGYQIKLVHVTEPDDNKCTLMSATKDGIAFALGCAFCHPNDPYNKVKGTQVAFTRMIETLAVVLGSTKLRELLK